MSIYWSFNRITPSTDEDDQEPSSNKTKDPCPLLVMCTVYIPCMVPISSFTKGDEHSITFGHETSSADLVHIIEYIYQMIKIAIINETRLRDQVRYKEMSSMDKISNYVTTQITQI